MTQQTFDVVVIGAGPAGENVLDRAVRGGLSAAVVEERLAGGECSYWACIPSKAMLRPVQAVAAARRLPGAAAAVSGEIDAAAVLARRDYFISDLDDAGQVAWLDSVPAAFFRGRGRITGERTVAVEGGPTLTARQAVVIATGTTPSIPPIPGLREAKPWTNREATTSKVVPGRLVVLGGGVVAVEMAQAYAALGATVTVVERGERLLARYPEFAADLVKEALEADGVTVHLSSAAESVRRPEPGGEVTVTLAGGTEVVADEVLAALGRRPGTDDLGLDTVGLEAGKTVEVDDSMRCASVPWLYAVGDANGRALLTHMGKYQARIAGDVIAARAAGRPDDGPGMRDLANAVAVPQVVFTDPQVCSVGKTEAGGGERSVEYDIASVSGAALAADGYRGRARMVVDERRRVVVGVTFVGADTAELLHSATVAIVGEVPLDRLWHAVPSFPTISEVWLRLLEEYGL